MSTKPQDLRASVALTEITPFKDIGYKVYRLNYLGSMSYERAHEGLIQLDPAVDPWQIERAINLVIKHGYVVDPDYMEEEGRWWRK